MICGMGETACKGHPVLSGQFSPIDIPQRMENKAMFTVAERLYLDADGNVVKANDPRKHSLLAAAGAMIPLEDARRYGLLQEPIALVSVETPEITVPDVPAKLTNGTNRHAKGRGTRRA